MTTIEIIIRNRLHGISDEQLDELKGTWPYSEIPHMMESFAKQQAIEFAEWIGTNGYINRESNPNQWIQQMDTLMEEQFTTEQLYTKFQEEQQ